MDSVLSGEVVACEKIRKLCRMMRPRIEGGYKCWHYDPEAARRPVEFIERFCCNPQGRPGQHLVMQPYQLNAIELTFGFVDENGLRQFNELMWVMARKQGKALSLDTQIPTPRGFVKMADVHPGDEVYGPDGKPTRVIVESGVFHKPMYAVTFEDGSVVKASGDHIWTVQTKASRRVSRGKYTTYHGHLIDADGWFDATTAEIAADALYRERADGTGREYSYRVPMTRPVEFPERELPIDPYLLGVWIGDGCRGKGSITCGNEDIDDMMAILSDCGYPIDARKYPYKDHDAWEIRVDHALTKGRGRGSRFRAALDRLGILWDKRIPEEYLTASVSQRVALLCGLMDTDGYASPTGQCEITQKKELIARQIAELCASLGIKANVYRKRATCNGKDAGDVYRLTFYTDWDMPCFRLGRKACRLKELLAPRMSAKSIVSIEEIPDEPSKCIAVDNDSHLFLAGRRYTATHNTTLMAALALYMLMADREGSPQCYSAATSKDQASLLYGAMLSMVRQSPALSKRLHKGIIPSRSQDGLIFRANDGYFTPLSSQTRNLDGLNVHFAAIDELAAITNRDTYDLVKQATSSREQPLIVEITTNGFERDNLFDQQYAYAGQLLDGSVEDDHFLPVIYELDSREEWTDERMWYKANPGLGTVKKLETLRGFYTKARQDPSFLPTFMTKDMDVPENKASAWLRYDEAVNRETFDMAEMGFRYGVFGYDASDSIDLTAAKCLMMRPDDDRIYELSMYWLPEAALEEHRRSGLRKSRDNVPYDIWERQGLIRIVPGNKVDHRVVFEWMAEVRDELDVYPFALGYDPWHLTDDSWQDMARQFVGKKRLEEVRQGAKTLSAPMKQIRADFAAGRIVDNDNPVNQWCRMNVSVTADRNDNILPCKANGASGRIDGFACELDAYIALMRHWDEYLANC